MSKHIPGVTKSTSLCLLTTETTDGYHELIIRGEQPLALLISVLVLEPGLYEKFRTLTPMEVREYFRKEVEHREQNELVDDNK